MSILENFNNTKFITFDIETNGLSLMFSHPWELYFQINQGNTILSKHLIYIKWPGFKISKDLAVKVHYSEEKVNRLGIKPEEGLELFDYYLYNPEYLLVASNAIGFDCFIHNSWRLNCGKNTDYSWLHRLYDTNILAKMYLLKLQKPKDIDWLTWNFKLDSIVQKGLKTGVRAMCTKFNLGYDELEAHSASYDVEKSFKIFKELLFNLEL